MTAIFDAWLHEQRKRAKPLDKRLYIGGYNQALASTLLDICLDPNIFHFTQPLQVAVMGPLEVEVWGAGDGIEASIVRSIGDEFATNNVFWSNYCGIQDYMRGHRNCSKKMFALRSKLDIKWLLSISQDFEFTMATTEGRVYEQRFHLGKPQSDRAWRQRDATDPALRLHIRFEEGWLLEDGLDRSKLEALFNHCGHLVTIS